MTNVICEICRSFNVKEPAVCVYEQHYTRKQYEGIIVKPLCESCRLRVMDIRLGPIFDGIWELHSLITPLNEYKEKNNGVIPRAS